MPRCHDATVQRCNDATVPRCHDARAACCCLLACSAAASLLLQPLAQPVTPAPMTIHRHEWKVSAPLPTCVWIDWRHSCGATVPGLSVAACLAVCCCLLACSGHVPAGWYELAVRPYAVMLTCGFTSSSSAPIQASFSFILTCCEAQGLTGW